MRFVGINVYGRRRAQARRHAVVADAREALRSLGRRARRAGLPTADAAPLARRPRAVGWRADLAADIAPRCRPSALGQGEVLATLNDEVARRRLGRRRGRLARPATCSSCGTRRPVGSAHLEFGFSCMGHEIPAGLGIRMARRRRPARSIVVIGDGTYLMNPTELVTAVQEGLKITVVVLDNDGYQSIHRLAIGSAGRRVGNEFRPAAARAASPTASGSGSTSWPTRPAWAAGRRWRPTSRRYGPRSAAARDGSEVSVIVVPTDPDRSLQPSGSFWDLGVPMEASEPEVAALTAAQWSGPPSNGPTYDDRRQRRSPGGASSARGPTGTSLTARLRHVDINGGVVHDLDPATGNDRPVPVPPRSASPSRSVTVRSCSVAPGVTSRCSPPTVGADEAAACGTRPARQPHQRG